MKDQAISGSGGPFGLTKNFMLMPNGEPAAFQAIYVKATKAVFYVLVVLVRKKTENGLLAEHRRRQWESQVNARSSYALGITLDVLKKSLDLHGADRITTEVRELNVAGILGLADRIKREAYMQKEAKRMAKRIELGRVPLPGATSISVKNATAFCGKSNGKI